MTDKIIKSLRGGYKDLDNCYSNVIFTFTPISNRPIKFEIDLEISIKNSVDKNKNILKKEYLSLDYLSSDYSNTTFDIGNYNTDKCCSYNLEIFPNDIINWYIKSKYNFEFKYKIDIKKTLMHCSKKRQRLIDKITYCSKERQRLIDKIAYIDKIF